MQAGLFVRDNLIHPSVISMSPMRSENMSSGNNPLGRATLSAEPELLRVVSRRSNSASCASYTSNFDASAPIHLTSMNTTSNPIPERTLRDRSTRYMRSIMTRDALMPVKSPPSRRVTSSHTHNSKKGNTRGKQLKLVTNMQQNGSKLVELGSPTKNEVSSTSSKAVKKRKNTQGDCDDDFEDTITVSPRISKPVPSRQILHQTTPLSHSKILFESPIVQEQEKEEREGEGNGERVTVTENTDHVASSTVMIREGEKESEICHPGPLAFTPFPETDMVGLTVEKGEIQHKEQSTPSNAAAAMMSLGSVTSLSPSPSVACVSETSTGTFRTRSSVPAKRPFEDIMDQDEGIPQEDSLNNFSTTPPSVTAMKVRFKDITYGESQVTKRQQSFLMPTKTVSSPDDARSEEPVIGTIGASDNWATATDLPKPSVPTSVHETRAPHSTAGEPWMAHIGLDELEVSDDLQLQVESKLQAFQAPREDLSNNSNLPNTVYREVANSVESAKDCPHLQRTREPIFGTKEELSDQHLEILVGLGARFSDAELKRNLEATVEVQRHDVHHNLSGKDSVIVKEEFPTTPGAYCTSRSRPTPMKADFHSEEGDFNRRIAGGNKMPSTSDDLDFPMGDLIVCRSQQAFLSENVPGEVSQIVELGNNTVELAGKKREDETALADYKPPNVRLTASLVCSTQKTDELSQSQDCDKTSRILDDSVAPLPRIADDDEFMELPARAIPRPPFNHAADSSNGVSDPASPEAISPTSPRAIMNRSSPRQLPLQPVTSPEAPPAALSLAPPLELSAHFELNDAQALPLENSGHAESLISDIPSIQLMLARLPWASHITRKDFATAASDRTKRKTSITSFNSQAQSTRSQQSLDLNMPPRKKIRKSDSDSCPNSSNSPSALVSPRRARSVTSSTDTPETSMRASPDMIVGICHHNRADPSRQFQEPTPVCYGCIGMSKSHYGPLDTISPKYCINSKVKRVPYEVVQEIVANRIAKIHGKVNNFMVRKYRINNCFRIPHEFDDPEMKDYIDVCGPLQTKINEEIFTLSDTDVDESSDTESASAASISDDTDSTVMERWTGGNVKGPKILFNYTAKSNNERLPNHKQMEMSMVPATDERTEGESDIIHYKYQEMNQHSVSRTLEGVSKVPKNLPTMGTFIPPPAISSIQAIPVIDSSKESAKFLPTSKAQIKKKLPRPILRSEVSTPAFTAVQHSPTESTKQSNNMKTGTVGLLDTGGLETLDEGVASEDDSIPGKNPYTARVAPDNQGKPGHERSIESRQSYKAWAQRRTERGLPGDYGGSGDTYIQASADLRYEDRYNIRKGSQVPLYGGGGTTVVRGLGESSARGSERPHLDTCVMGMIDVRRVNEPFTAAIQEIARLIKESGHSAGVFPGTKMVLSGLKLDAVFFTGDQEKSTIKPTYGRALDFSGAPLIKGMTILDPITNHQYTLTWTWAVLPALSVSKASQTTEEVRGITEKEVRAGFQIHLVVAKPGRAKDREDRKRLVFHERFSDWVAAHVGSKNVGKKAETILPLTSKPVVNVAQTQPQASDNALTQTNKLKSLIYNVPAADSLTELAWKTNWEKFRWERWELDALMKGLTRLWRIQGGTIPDNPDKKTIYADVQGQNLLSEWLEDVIIGQPEEEPDSETGGIDINPSQNGNVSPSSTVKDSPAENINSGIATPTPPPGSNRRSQRASISAASKFKSFNVPTGTISPDPHFEALQAFLDARDISTLIRRSNRRKKILRIELEIPIDNTHPAVGPEKETQSYYIRRVLGWVDFKEEEEIYGVINGGRRIDELAEFDWKHAARMKGVAQEVINARDMLINADTSFRRKVREQNSCCDSTETEREDVERDMDINLESSTNSQVL